ncbi:MAG: hypothetical protein ACRDT0_11750 [Pseudonocardiaceae bacterium]
MTMQDDTQHVAELAPLCSEEEFAQEVAALVADGAPRLFALVEEYGDRADGWVRAWGMAFDDHAEVVSVDRGLLGTFPSAERAHRAFSRRAKVRLVWHPDAPRTDGDHAA